MSLLVDTSVWSLALRRDAIDDSCQDCVDRLQRALTGQEAVFVTGIVLQELLQGFRGPRARDQILERFSSLAWLEPAREDFVAAADMGNRCRRRGVPLGTIDALIAALCIRNDLVLLSSDRDFVHAMAILPLQVWSEPERR